MLAVLFNSYFLPLYSIFSRNTTDLLLIVRILPVNSMIIEKNTYQDDTPESGKIPVVTKSPPSQIRNILKLFI